MGKIPRQGPNTNTNTNTNENTGRILIRVKVGKLSRQDSNTNTNLKRRNENTGRILIRVKVGKVPWEVPGHSLPSSLGQLVHQKPPLDENEEK